MARKKIDVTRVLEMTNHYLRELPGNDEAHRNMRFGAAAILESVLHETGNYAGFQYLAPYKAHPDFDESRRVYYRK